LNVFEQFIFNNNAINTSMQAKQIKVLNKESLSIKWDDNSESNITLKYLRDECPCANCKGETILLKTYRPARPASTAPGMYKVKNIEMVGSYAIQISWQDGHNTGIYSWEYLRKLDETQGSSKKHNYDDLV
jgi:DUF971 family protein